MAEVDALGLAGGAGRVKRSGAGVLIGGREIVPGLGTGKQRFVFGIENKSGLNGLSWHPLVTQEDEPFPGVDVIPDLLQQRKKLPIDQEDVILGVIDRVKDLLG